MGRWPFFVWWRCLSFVCALMSFILFTGHLTLTLLLFLFQFMYVGWLWSRTFHVYIYIYIYIFIFMAQQPLVGQGLLFVHSWQSHSLDTPHSVGLLWTSDQPDAETWTWRPSTLTRDRPTCLRGGFEPATPASKRQLQRKFPILRGIIWREYMILLLSPPTFPHPNLASTIMHIRPAIQNVFRF